MKAKNQGQQATKTAGSKKARARRSKNAKASSKKYLVICLVGKRDSAKSLTLAEVAEVLHKKSTKFLEKKTAGMTLDRNVLCYVHSKDIGICTYGDAIGQI